MGASQDVTQGVVPLQVAQSNSAGARPLDTQAPNYRQPTPDCLACQDPGRYRYALTLTGSQWPDSLFKRRIRAWLKVLQAYNIDYHAQAHRHKSGHIHVHLALGVASHRLLIRLIRRYWKGGHKLVRIWDRRGWLHYMLTGKPYLCSPIVSYDSRLYRAPVRPVLRRRPGAGRPRDDRLLAEARETLRNLLSWYPSVAKLKFEWLLPPRTLRRALQAEGVKAVQVSSRQYEYRYVA